MTNIALAKKNMAIRVALIIYFATLLFLIVALLSFMAVSIKEENFSEEVQTMIEEIDESTNEYIKFSGWLEEVVDMPDSDAKHSFLYSFDAYDLKFVEAYYENNNFNPSLTSEAVSVESDWQRLKTYQAKKSVENSFKEIDRRGEYNRDETAKFLKEIEGATSD